jgi:DNA-binding HxlR family transcriptional regulator
MGIRTDLLVTEEIAESSDLRATPFEFERAKRVEEALSILEGKWKIVILNRLFARKGERGSTDSTTPIRQS